jgi:acetyl esterase/lipase
MGETDLSKLLGTGSDRFWYEPSKTYVYKETPQGALEMQVHFPYDLRWGEQRPAIVFFFGGGWKGGTVKQFARQAAYLAGRGMVAVRADYRVRSRHGVLPDACVEDAKSAVRWLRQHADELCIDPARIVGAGGSAGAHIAACAALVEGFEAEGQDRAVSCRPDALVLYNPVLEVPPRVIPGMVPTEEMAAQISPVRYVDERTPPTLLLYGTEDQWIEPAPSYVQQAIAAGCRAELYLAEGQGHGFFNEMPWFERTLRRVEEFLTSLGYLS